MKSANKDMADSMFFWGIPKIYKLGYAVAATDWDHVNEKKKAKINRDVGSVAARIRKKHGRVRPGLKTKGFFNIMRMLQKNGWNERDVIYWKEKGWNGKKRPWN